LAGAPIDLERVQLPKSGYSVKTRKRWPDLIVRWEIVLVSDLVRNAIGTFEPQIHQFIPFELRNGKRGAPTEIAYYILNIAQSATSMDLDQTAISTWRENIQKVTLAVASEFQDQRFVLRAGDHKGLHLWRENYDGHAFYMSDDLFALCSERKANGLEIKHHFEDV